MVILSRRFKRTDGAGFTLVELLLTVALLLGLMAALVYNFWPLQSGASLEEGARQFEALARFASAQAANSGHAVQFHFEEASTNEVYASGPQMRVVWEADPIGQPGVLSDLPEAAPFVASLKQLIKISDVKGARRPANQGTNEVSFTEDILALPPPITFFPDGSSDTADIVLTSRSPDDFREMVIHISGVTGTIRSELRIFDDYDEFDSMDPETPPPATAAVTPQRVEAVQPVEPTQPNFDDTTSTNSFFDEDWP